MGVTFHIFWLVYFGRKLISLQMASSWILLLGSLPRICTVHLCHVLVCDIIILTNPNLYFVFYWLIIDDSYDTFWYKISLGHLTKHLYDITMAYQTLGSNKKNQNVNFFQIGLDPPKLSPQNVNFLKKNVVDFLSICQKIFFN